jgi:hypothetical protein
MFPLHTPNTVVASGDDWHISYNASAQGYSDYGSITTALVTGNHAHFYVLSGDHRKGYEGLTLDECKKYFLEHLDQINKHSEDPSELYMDPKDAWLYAATWGSYMTGRDPGACMYGFNEKCRPQSEDHRERVLEHMTKCRERVVNNPDDYDDEDELEKLDQFVKFITCRSTSTVLD